MSKRTVFSCCLSAVACSAQALMVTAIPEQRIVRATDSDDMVRVCSGDHAVRMALIRIHAARMAMQASSAILLPFIPIAAPRCGDPLILATSFGLALRAVSTVDQPHACRPVRTHLFRH